MHDRGDNTHLLGLSTLFPGLRSTVDDDKSLSFEQLTDLIRREFREEAGDSSEVQQLDEAFAALRVLNEQAARIECSSDTVSGPLREDDSGSTCRVRVEARSGFISQNPQGEWMFTYQITVSNEGEDIVQLLGRQWEILDADDRTVASVPRNSPGVVGETPILKPGESFQYSSGTGLPTARGSMGGSFQMATVDLEAKRHRHFFDAAVGSFQLSEAVRAGPVQ